MDGPKMKPTEHVERALALSDAGWNNCQIARELKVNRRTVSDWTCSACIWATAPSQPTRVACIDCGSSSTVLIDECVAAISLVMPMNKVGLRHPKKTYVYPRYLFTNRSVDIQRIFCGGCDRLGIEWRQDGPWNVSVARRESVAALDRHVGPKR
jgi:hypothetical protein